MNYHNEAKKILELIYHNDSETKNFLSESFQKRKYFTITGQENLRWIIPDAPHFGIPALSQWRPYNHISLIKWKILLFLYSIRLLKMIKGIESLEFIHDKQYTQVKKNGQNLIPVVYVGTPGPSQKAVVTFIDPVTAAPVYVMKVALEKNSRESLVRESEILKKMAYYNIPGIPKIISVDNGGNKTIQTFIHGHLTSRKLTQAHIDWLLKLPKSEKTTTFNEQKDILLNMVFKKKTSITNKKIIIHAINTIKGNQVIPFLVTHGDFAPWNLKWHNKNEIAAIDWEDSDLNGLPLWDLSHFYCMQAHLFGGINPFNSISSCPLTAQYLKKTGLEKIDIRQLYILYLLKKIISQRALTENSYGNFLLKQIQLIIRQ